MKAKGNKKPSYTFASAEIMDAAATIAAIKGEDIDRLLGDFVNGYVTENLHVLTQKAQENSGREHCHGPAEADPAAVVREGEKARSVPDEAQATAAKSNLLAGGVNGGRDQNS